ncbi:MAG: mannose-1-phosphate guanylyltransferase [bacterium]|nr:mannose-1-phosphate guanylyltransferase [bacterium]
MNKSPELNIRPVILAGGQGTRFWPISRVARPKQFLSIAPGGESLIQATVKRLTSLCNLKDVVIVTNEKHESLVREHVPGCDVISEPVGRNTAASIGLAAINLIKNSPNSVMVVFPADHYVENVEKLLERIRVAVNVAKSGDYLVALGITASSANTAYGYIKRGEPHENPGAYSVSRFYEKPSLERARKYIEEGGFYWNSGIFIWRPEVVLKGIETYMPELYKGLIEIRDSFGKSSELRVMEDVFNRLEGVSIDFGLLEHARNCVVVESGEIGWNDVGSWDAWAYHFKTDIQNNLLRGEALAIDSKDCVVYSSERLIAILGCEDLVVIDSKDALLVCPRSKVQDVKEVVAELTRSGRKNLV